MKSWWCPIFLALVLFVFSELICSVRDSVFGQNPVVPNYAVPQVVVRQPPPMLGMLVDFVTIDDPINPAKKIRVITVVDTESKRIAVFHEEMSEGTVKLCSVRNIQHDLMIEQYNPTEPTPRFVEENMLRFKNK